MTEVRVVIDRGPAGVERDLAFGSRWARGRTFMESVSYKRIKGLSDRGVRSGWVGGSVRRPEPPGYRVQCRTHRPILPARLVLSGRRLLREWLWRVQATHFVLGGR